MGLFIQVMGFIKLIEDHGRLIESSGNNYDQQNKTWSGYEMVALFQMAGAGPEHIKELQVGAVQHSKTVCRDFPGFSTNVL